MITEMANLSATVSITEPWFTALIDECKDIVTEAEFTNRWALVEGYHGLGKRILEETDNFERAKIYGQEIVQRIAISLGKRDRTIYYAIQFAKLYPDLSLLKEGKNISWSHVINKYLTEGEKLASVKKVDYENMVKLIKTLLETEWRMANQEWVEAQTELNKEVFLSRCNLIRHLQDQVEKITHSVTQGVTGANFGTTSTWARLPNGTTGQTLRMNAGKATPKWGGRKPDNAGT